MKTKSFFLYVYITVNMLLLVGCDRDRSKERLEIDYPDRIKGIIVEGAWDITIFQDETASAYIDYSVFLEDKIVAGINSDGYLHLKLKNVMSSMGVKRSDLVAYINIPNIELVKASGSAHISINGLFNGESCKVDLNGASKVKEFDYNGTNVEIDLDGSSECKMFGEANSVKMSLNGSSDAYMINFTTKTLDINLNGASDAEIHIDEKATGKLSGASTLKYRGEADVSEIKLNGGSKIKKQ